MAFHKSFESFVSRIPKEDVLAVAVIEVQKVAPYSNESATLQQPCRILTSNPPGVAGAKVFEKRERMSVSKTVLKEDKVCRALDEADIAVFLSEPHHIAVQVDQNSRSPFLRSLFFIYLNALNPQNIYDRASEYAFCSYTSRAAVLKKLSRDL